MCAWAEAVTFANLRTFVYFCTFKIGFSANFCRAPHRQTNHKDKITCLHQSRYAIRSSNFSSLRDTK